MPKQYEVIRTDQDCVKGEFDNVISNKLSWDEANCLVFNKAGYNSRLTSFRVEEMGTHKQNEALKAITKYWSKADHANYMVKIKTITLMEDDWRTSEITFDLYNFVGFCTKEITQYHKL